MFKTLNGYAFPGHHPDLHLVGWNNVKIDVWTHSVRKSNQLK
uniref:Uncharacterized protein n=1 Tax=Aegilops tauschii subsp. strangulata TaxID=200361 RepID=A0A453PMP2_AEGTS